MQRLLLAVALVVGCTPSIAPPVSDGRLPSSFDVPIGAACDVTVAVLCDEGAGACVDAVCRADCSAVTSPRCPAGETEHHAVVNTADQCTCVPS